MVSCHQQLYNYVFNRIYESGAIKDETSQEYNIPWSLYKIKNKLLFAFMDEVS